MRLVPTALPTAKGPDRRDFQDFFAVGIGRTDRDTYREQHRAADYLPLYLPRTSVWPRLPTALPTAKARRPAAGRRGRKRRRQVLAPSEAAVEPYVADEHAVSAMLGAAVGAQLVRPSAYDEQVRQDLQLCLF